MYTLRMFALMFKYRFFAQIEYPGAYISGIIAQWLVYGIEMMMVFLMVWNFGALAGWLPVEVVFIYTIWLMTYALAAIFTFNICINFDQLVINGTIDEARIRPLPPFAYLLSTHINVGYISHITLTAVALGVSISQLGLRWSVWQWLWLFVMLISGAVITGCIMLLCNMPAMRTHSRSPFSMIFWETRIFNMYPITIYPQSLQFIFTAVLPLGFINFYPAQVLLGRQDGLGAPMTMWLSPAVAALLVAITAFSWQKLSRHYESSGT
ncbi:MAG: ABC transporter permease [Defluviitaleaceae bacterium]|nr:ABC transporter permease [Defluviitaleaceae bacterium]